MRSRVELNQPWDFLLDPNDEGVEEKWFRQELKGSHPVKLPHTVNTEVGLEEYHGVMWYAYRFTARESWQGKRILLQFGGIYRDVEFWMNGIHIGSHLYSGFTSFSIDCKDTVMAGYENRLVIRVDNSFSDQALPMGRSFDWADDGGIFRPAYLMICEEGAINWVHIDAIPCIPALGKRIDRADVDLLIRVHPFLFPPHSEMSLEYRIYDEKTLIYQAEPSSIVYPPTPVRLKDMELWHFDHPKLYRLVLEMKENGRLYDKYEVSFGCRQFEMEGNRFVLNGEYVRLIGLEWMPGSNPRYGNAEPVEYIERTLQQLKESNCVFTRFHWQQDDAVYDWCDRHGMLVQEEIPNWGPREQGAWQIMVSRQQAEEMIDRHGNHPSIIAWGIGNELSAKEKQTQSCLKEVLDYVRLLDPYRMIHYVSNSVWTDPKNDGAGISDSLWANEYFGTWMPKQDVDQALDQVAAAYPEKPIVISEFGLCESAFGGGDRKRIQVFREKMRIYRQHPEVAAAIHFSLNDYRTQIGEEGAGRFRRRVHGTTEMDGTPKPSYYVVQQEYAPIEVVETPGLLTFRCKNGLPEYTVQGYQLHVGTRSYSLPTLKPGQQWTMEWNGDNYEVVRSTGERTVRRENFV